jgi:hypothetical protein
MATATLEKSMADYSTVPTSTTVQTTTLTTTTVTTVPAIVVKPIELPVLPKLPVYDVPKPYVERKVAEIKPDEAKVFAELLTAAAERLRTKGWIRGVMGGSKGPNCAVGAIEQTAFEQTATFASLQQMERLYSAVLHFNGMLAPISPFNPGAARDSVIYWNDGSSRQRDDVIFAFEKTAAELKGLSDLPAVPAA